MAIKIYLSEPPDILKEFVDIYLNESSDIHIINLWVLAKIKKLCILYRI